VNKSVAAAGPADATNSPTEHLESLDQGAISVLTLDDPKRANAMSREMGDAFTSRVRAIQDDPALRVVIIRGAGRDFSIGGHRDMLISLGSGKLVRLTLRRHRLSNAFLEVTHALSSRASTAPSALATRSIFPGWRSGAAASPPASAARGR
jgi:enoyl-CoA hydratase/carnithine racemase